MFVWRAATLLDCIRRYEPAVADGLPRWLRPGDAPPRRGLCGGVSGAEKDQRGFCGDGARLARSFGFRVAAIPMRLDWLDVGSWPSFAQTCPRNARATCSARRRHLLLETDGCLVASDDPQHLIATIGCRDLVVIHTRTATLICTAATAEKIKDLQKLVAKQFGGEYT